MNDTHTLTRHQDIQNWVSNHKGLPAIKRIPDHMGEMRARLAIHFGRSTGTPEAASLDDGLMPVSWSAWLAELDRQGLALKVSSPEQFEFVPRRELN